MLLASSFIISILNILTTHALLTRKKSVIYCLIAFFLNSLFAISAAILTLKYISVPSTVKYILYFLGFTYIIYIHFIFKESISKKIFTMLSISVLSSIAFFIATASVNSFLGTLSGKNIDFIIYITRFCIQLIFWAVIYFHFKEHYKKVFEVVTDKTVNFMSLYPLVAYLTLINNYPISFQFRNFNNSYDMFLFLLLMILGYLFVFEGVYSASQVISLRYNYKIVENQVELQRQNYKRFNESLEQLYALKHDIRHHFSAIKSMLDEEKYPEAMEYISHFNQNETAKNIPTLCQNFTADSIVKYYMSIAAHKNIDFKTNIKIPENININPLDLCVVFGNCIENAIEACDKLGDENKKYIRFTSQIINSHLVLRIVNSFDGSVIKNNMGLQSTKPETSHGLGISSVRATVNKYKGNLDIKYTENEFEVNIAMNINCLIEKL